MGQVVFSMLACLDVDYRDQGACAAAVVYHHWTDAVPAEEKTVDISVVQPYEPGQFFRRELPCLLAVIRLLPPLEAVIIDGYVWLDTAAAKPGLGAHLYEALDRKCPVIGVAKTKFHGADGASEVLRGTSQRPLYITAAGMPPDVAADHVRTMHGAHRIPTLLGLVDNLCRRGRSL